MWCFTTYFAEGLPYTIVRMVSSLFFRTMQVSLESIGLTSLFSLPWICKFLWAPQVDRFGTRRTWMLIMQLFLGALFIVVALFVPFTWGIPVVAALLFVGSWIAATHDVAIDGYYLVALDEREQAQYVGYRVMAYRIAMMTGTGGVVTIGTTLGWTYAFACAGMLMLLLYLYHLLFLPQCEHQRYKMSEAGRVFLRPRFLLGVAAVAAVIMLLRAGVQSSHYQALQKVLPVLSGIGFSGWVSLLLLAGLIVLALFRQKLSAQLYRHPDSFYTLAFSSFMERKHIGLILTFIVLLRTGEFLLSAMVAPFMVDIGIKIHYGWLQAAVGLPASIVGALLGGYLIARFSLRRMVFPFLLAQNLTNVVYMVLALFLAHFVNVNTGNAHPEPIGAYNLFFVAAVQGFDQFAGGLGTAILMTILMRICRGEFKAAHYAIGSGLMNISGLVTGVASGFLAARLGYGYFFGLSFLVALPGMFLALPVVRVLDREKELVG